MISAVARHMESGGRILASCSPGLLPESGTPGMVRPLRKSYKLRGSYVLDPANGGAAASVQFVFPGDKYDALVSAPTWAHHRFLGWFDAAGTPDAAGTTVGNAVSPDDDVDYERPAVYAQWQTPTAIAFDVDTGGGEMPSGWTSPDYYAGQPYGSLPTPTHPTLSFTGWSVDGTVVSSESTVPSGGATLVAQFASAGYIVDLNGEWLDPDNASSQTWVESYEEGQSEGEWVDYTPPENPDPSLYDGVYESVQGPGRNSHFAWMKIEVSGYTSFRVYIRSWAESDYDFMVALHADEDPLSNDYADDTYFLPANPSVKACTQGNQTDGTNGIDDYTAVDYDLDGGVHDIWIGFVKDVSVGENDDRGFVLIPKVQGGQ